VVEHWSHSCLLKELDYLSNALREEPRWNVLCSYNEGVHITKGWFFPSSWLFYYPHDFLTSYEFLAYMTLHITHVSFGLPLYNEYNIHGKKWWCGIWQLVTKHDMALLILTAWMMWKFQLLLLPWMMSFRKFSHLPPPRGLVIGIFNDLKSWVVVMSWCPLIFLCRSACMLSYRNLFCMSSSFITFFIISPS